MAMPTKKVAFAESTVTVHVKRVSEPSLLPDGTQVWDVESKIMLPGETISLVELPPYLSNAVELGEVPGLKAMTPNQVKQRVELYQEIGMLNSPAELVSEEQEDSEFPAEEV